MKTILELPPNLDLEQLHTLVNDRFRDINAALAILVSNPAEPDTNIDLGANRIINLADPAGDLDAVNLRTLKRGATTAAKIQPVAPVKAAPVSGLDFYTIVFTKDGIVADGDTAPSFVVDAGREGIVAHGWFFAKGPPQNDANFNMTVTVGAVVNTVFTADAVILANATVPTFATNLKFKARMVKGNIVDLKVGAAGSASSFTAGLVVHRT